MPSPDKKSFYRQLAALNSGILVIVALTIVAWDLLGGEPSLDELSTAESIPAVRDEARPEKKHVDNDPKCPSPRHWIRHWLHPSPLFERDRRMMYWRTRPVPEAGAATKREANMWKSFEKQRVVTLVFCEFVSQFPEEQGVLEYEKKFMALNSKNCEETIKRSKKYYEENLLGELFVTEQERLSMCRPMLQRQDVLRALSMASAMLTRQKGRGSPLI
eukprot:CAMPEP_0198351112 /NCGR_PEP_ID=MMETSP1450-20131203/101604_1 /TAXON_ID=753684 ORGANISM="Madagascaria erythrocladiodes, Strain CCMP3234" /NCGR_SAMPLE_ID=MMETSP1450 /ASSEMBLY_ACC=CAM_ASM_001115 /LENGTH=216 /DNA_ID=CAMNT_0044057005 /DNA_START=94 /DNA_END=744 /DNA_ORIENTATION=+